MRHRGDLLRLLRRLPGIEFHDGSVHPKVEDAGRGGSWWTRSFVVSEGAAAAHDVLLVGGGAAGLRAAIAIAETNPSLSVAVVSKVYPMRSHTVSAEGGAAGAIARGRHSG